MIKKYVRWLGADFEEFTKFAFGELVNPQYWDVPKIWNSRHPDCIIKGSDNVEKSINKMVQYFTRVRHIT